MTGPAIVSIMTCRGVGSAAEIKLMRLDIPISEVFHRGGYVVRLCQGRTADDGGRWLDFCGDILGQAIVASVPAGKFTAASDGEAVSLVARACP